MEEKVKELVEQFIPNSKASVNAYKPDHYAIEVISPIFEGKTLIEQHKMVHEALKDVMGSAIHAVNITTKIGD